MEDKKLEILLSQLAEQTAEAVRADLADDIKQHIPERLLPHRLGMNTINIIVDLRVNKLAAAAAIIITLVLLVTLYGGRNPTTGNLVQDGKLLARYLLGGEAGFNISTSRSQYEYLVRQGKEVFFYENIDARDSNAVLMHWKVSDNKHRVIFSDLREAEVDAEELIRLQGQMLRKKGD